MRTLIAATAAAVALAGCAEYPVYESDAYYGGSSVYASAGYYPAPAYYQSAPVYVNAPRMVYAPAPVVVERTTVVQTAPRVVHEPVVVRDGPRNFHDGPRGETPRGVRGPDRDHHDRPGFTPTAPRADAPRAMPEPQRVAAAPAPTTAPASATPPRRDGDRPQNGNRGNDNRERH